jgi:type IV pilus assembly protein PilY1
VAGGVIASLGTKEDTAHTMANTRRFYAAPDTALIEPVGGKAFLNVAIGSGYRGHPVNAEVSDRLYSVRDYHPFTPLTQSQYDGLHLIVDGDLADITSTLTPTIADGAYGWKLLLNLGSGEKVVTSARTLNNVVYFTSYTPSTTVTTTSSDPCGGTAQSSGTNRVYAVNVFTGAPIKDRNDDGSITVSDRSTELRQGGIAPGISLLFPGETENKDDVLVMSGPEKVDTCADCRSLRKTYWYDGSVQ